MVKSSHCSNVYLIKRDQFLVPSPTSLLIVFSISFPQLFYKYTYLVGPNLVYKDGCSKHGIVILPQIHLIVR